MTHALSTRVKAFFARPFFSDRRTLLGVWLLVAVSSTLKNIKEDNNFAIFKYVFFHVWSGQPLYEAYPAEYWDINHYGPFFSLVIAPFALAPHPLGLVLWHIALAASLFWAVKALPVAYGKKVFIYWFCAHELLTALFMSQFNVAIAAIIVGSYVCVQKEKDCRAAFLIVVGTLIKIYGIVGLAFFLFSKHKVRFAIWLAVWGAALFCAPMLISGWDYIVGQYKAWYACLTEKNAENMFSLMQNVSLLGIVRKVTQCATYSDLWLIVPGLAAFTAPYLRFRQHRHEAFRLSLLASVLLFVVLFSTGSESSGYITALLGVAVWYVCAPWQRSHIDLVLLVFAFVLTSLSPSDLFPKVAREAWVKPYALKALPCALIWVKLVWEMLTRDYAATEKAKV